MAGQRIPPHNIRTRRQMAEKIIRQIVSEKHGGILVEQIDRKDR